MLTAPATAAERLRTRPSIGWHARPPSLLAAVAAAAPRPSRRRTAASATAASRCLSLAAADPAATALGWQDVADTVELMNQLDTDKNEHISWQEWSHGCAVWLHQMGQA